MSSTVSVAIPGPGSAAFLAAAVLGWASASVSIYGLLGIALRIILLTGTLTLVLVGYWVERLSFDERRQEREQARSNLDRLPLGALPADSTKLAPPVPPGGSGGDPPSRGGAVPPAAMTAPSVASEELIRVYTADILDKKYKLYDWCETKVQTLVTLDGLLLAGLFVILANRRLDTIWADSTAALALLLLISSLLIALWHIRPLMYSGLSQPKNPRTVVGTEAYESTDEYLGEIMKLNVHRMIQLDADQIRGMNRNIWKNQRAINWAVYAAMASIAPLAVFIGLGIPIHL